MFRNSRTEKSLRHRSKISERNGSLYNSSVEVNADQKQGGGNSGVRLCIDYGVTVLSVEFSCGRYVLGCVGKSRRLWGRMGWPSESLLSGEGRPVRTQNYAVVPNAADNQQTTRQNQPYTQKKARRGHAGPARPERSWHKLQVKDSKSPREQLEKKLHKWGDQSLAGKRTKTPSGRRFPKESGMQSSPISGSAFLKSDRTSVSASRAERPIE